MKMFYIFTWWGYYETLFEIHIYFIFSLVLSMDETQAPQSRDFPWLHTKNISEGFCIFTSWGLYNLIHLVWYPYYGGFMNDNHEIIKGRP